MSNQPSTEELENFAKSIDEFKNRVRHEDGFSEEQKKDLLLQAGEVRSLDNQHLQKLIDQYSRILEGNAKALAKKEDKAEEKAKQEAARTQTDPNPTPKKQEPLKKTTRGKGRGLSLAGNRRKH